MRGNRVRWGMDRICRGVVKTAAAVALGASAFLIAFANGSAADNVEPELMFVQTGAEMSADSNTLRLVNAAPLTLWFSDRPFRIAGHIDMAMWFEEWTDSAGADNFSNDPPNATISIYEPGNPEPTLAVVEISEPVLDGNDLVYRYVLIEGTVPTTGKETVLFIDWIGVGGGVGAGYHGVGLGTRGAGVLPGRCPAGAINIC